MPRKKVDSRVRTLIENGVISHQRSFFVLVGDRGKDQVATLHYLLTKAQVKARPQVLWCYNKELGFSTHRQKRMKQARKMQMRGLTDTSSEDPFDMFVTSTQVRWCYYKETSKILGNTYGMAVLQDFEAITPNILCRTIETVEGGGIVVLLLHTMSSLKQLYTMAMDVHARFRTEAHQDVVGRFNERFILSLASCKSCLVLDDELNVLPISEHAKHIKPLAPAASAGAGGDDDDDRSGGVTPLVTESQKELTELKASLASTELVGSLVNQTRTLDQAKAILTFAEAISEKTLRSTVALTAGRGRGKSAALGLAIAAAIGYGYSNIFVTSPSPENLTTLFQFVFKGLEALAFKEHIDWEAVASTNPEFNKAIVRVNIFRGHRQTVQYIEPHDADKLAQAELVVIDEAAAIPLPLVKRLLGPYLVFLASTINGYEGTGRSLSLKLIQQLRQQQAAAAMSGGGAPGGSRALTTGALPGASGAVAGRTLREVLLSEPIRYSAGDQVEAWLNTLLCLDATTPYRLGGRLPAPSECSLYAVDRDALFAYHALSEAFLHRVMSLYVSSHYKNTPNDLQLLSDAPAHKLFVLLGPVSSDASGLPDVLCVIQVCLEGRISKDALMAQLTRGARAAGDLIPWTLSQQFQDDNFATLSGARVVRIATHPDATKMGYGSRALQLLSEYFEGNLVTLSGDAEDEGIVIEQGLHRKRAAAGAGASSSSSSSNALTKEVLAPTREPPPLMVNVTDLRRPERLHWLGVSYGLTLQLFNFWKRAGYAPMYLRQTPNDLTAEHTAIMLKPLNTSDMPAAEAPRAGWHLGFVADFTRRFMTLLSFEFRQLDVTLALSVLDAGSAAFGSAAGAEGGDASASTGAGAAAAASLESRGTASPLTATELGVLFTPHDTKRLESYARNMVDYHMILDLLPDLARLYFQYRLPGVSLPRLQAGILMAMGCQRLTVEAVSEHFQVEVNQILAMFNKSVRKMSTALLSIQEAAVEAEMLSSKTTAASRASGAGASAKAAAASASSETPVLPKAARDALMRNKEVAKYAIPAGSALDEAIASAAADGTVPTVLSVKKAGAGTPITVGDKRKSSGGHEDGAIYDPRGRLSSGGKHKKARSAAE